MSRCSTKGLAFVENDIHIPCLRLQSALQSQPRPFFLVPITPVVLCQLVKAHEHAGTGQMTNELVMKVNVHELDRSAMFYGAVTGGESLDIGE